MEQKLKQDDTWRDSPTAWFVAMEMALEKGDYTRAAEAQQELKRLGVKVRFARRAKVVHDEQQ